MFDAITIGSATQDAFLVSKQFQTIRSERFETGAGECLAFGSKIELDDFALTTGGGGTNSAATFAALGFNTAIVTRIGADAAGRAVMDDLVVRGISTSLLKTVKNGSTGFGAQLTAPNGERSVLVHRGVSGTFSDRDIPRAKLNARMLYLTSLGGNTALALSISRHAAQKKMTLMWNPGSLELTKGIKALEPIIRNVSILNMNLEEAQILTKQKTRDVKKLASKLARPGITLLLTDGPNGAYAAHEGTIYFARTRNIKSVSRTGAGDAFGSGFGAARLAEKSVEDALAIGTANAESVIQFYGAKRGILNAFPKPAILKQIKVRAI